MKGMKRHNLNSREELQQEARNTTSHSHPLEFRTAEDMLRHDALHTPVPPSVESRLVQSLGPALPEKHKPWWRRLFGS